MNHFRQTVAEALGCKASGDGGEFAQDNLWTHATDRQLLGWERRRVDPGALVAAYAQYKNKDEWQSAYLDWVFLDAMMYSVIYELIDNLHNDVLGPADTGNFVPHIQHAFANSSDAEKKSPMWLDIKRTLQLVFFRWWPTMLLLALGIGCFFVGDGWPKTGLTILGLLAARRIYRSVRWLARFGLRRRTWKMIGALTDAYALLGARVVPTLEVRQAVERARDILGRSAIFGGNFWAVLDDVCARHPSSLIPSCADSK